MVVCFNEEFIMEVFLFILKCIFLLFAVCFVIPLILKPIYKESIKWYESLIFGISTTGFIILQYLM
jgi:hypothetical protein